MMIGKLRNKGVELYLNAFTHKPVIENWKLEPSKLKKVSIRWTDKYEWDEAECWVNLLLYGFRQHVKVDIVSDIPQLYTGTVNFQLVINGNVRDVAIGYSDYLPIDENCARSCDLYFKMQYDRNGYGYSHVVPGGYVPDGKRLYFDLKNLRKLADQKRFLYDVYGRFGLDYAREIREKAVDILNRQNSFRFVGGMKKVSYHEFLKEVARSKICIDLPGLGDFCFRLMNYMAVGACIIAYPHRTMLHVPLVDRKHMVYVKEDFSDLVELCEYYLENNAEREAIARNCRGFFDLNLHKDNLAKYYLQTCLARLS